MHLLPNGCRCSELVVFPKNWKMKSADMDRTWYISYRFYDAENPKPKQVIIKGMNHYKTITERQMITQSLLANELDMLKNQGYNPFKKDYVRPFEEQYGLDPDTPFIKALREAFKTVQCTEPTRRDIKSVLKYTEAAARDLLIHTVPIGEIRKKHIRAILDQLAKTKKVWSANQFNHYRKYLSLLFSELAELEAVDFNPVTAIKKQRTVQRIREQLTMDQRRRVDEYLAEHHYNFWRVMHIFFHSGARESELMKVRKEDVDLAAGFFKVIVKKGKSHSEKLKPIKRIAAELWEEVMSEARPGDYLFSKGLRPATKPIDPRQLTRRWRLHVKKKLKITADLYSLKHSNLDEIAAAIGINRARDAADHTNVATTINHYATGEKRRQLAEIREVGNHFVSDNQQIV